MPPLRLRDGTEISLDSNLPLQEIPEELQNRLKEVLADLRVFLKSRDHFPEVGTLLVDERGKRAIVRSLDVDEFAFIYLINGFFSEVRKDGKLSEKDIPVRTEPWPHRATGPDRWDRHEDAETFVNNKVNGEVYRVLGKYVDYHHD